MALRWRGPLLAPKVHGAEGAAETLSSGDQVSALAAVAVSVSGKTSHYSVGECGELILDEGTGGKIFDIRKNGGNGTVKNRYFVPFYCNFLPLAPIFTHFLPFPPPFPSHPPPIFHPFSPIFHPFPPVFTHFSPVFSHFPQPHPATILHNPHLVCYPMCHFPPGGWGDRRLFWGDFWLTVREFSRSLEGFTPPPPATPKTKSTVPHLLYTSKWTISC